MTSKASKHPIFMQATYTSNQRSIRVDTSIPAGPGPHPAIVLLHGSGGNSGAWLERITPFVTRLKVAVFAIHYFDCTGAARAEPGELYDGIHVPLWLRTIRDGIDHIADLPAVDPARIALIGVSLGGFLSLALGTQPDHRIKTIVEISAGLVPPFDQQATSAFPSTLILHGDRDTLVPISMAHDLDATLTRLNVLHQTNILTGETHFFSDSAKLRMLGSIALFLRKHL